MRRSSPPSAVRGFTLVEAVIVIMVTGILAAMVGVFITKPVEGYFDSARRAELTDIADTALRRMARDLHAALPNSVRVDASGKYLEFIPIKGVGRYCSEVGASAAWTSTPCTDALNVGGADTSFQVLGPVPPMAAGDSIVVYNLGISGADAYAGDDRTTFSSLAGSIVTIASKVFPLDSPGKRFQVISAPATYFCDGATGRLLRYAGYAFSTAQPTPPGGMPAVLATGVNCALSSFSYTTTAQQRSGLVVIVLTLTQSGESVTLQHQVNVENTP